ncbi:uncharacterized protein LOC143066760 [Mytilus galloprovincialis]|uniref:uncharacterized protein LOC143066760 n=1 Tax=Mytilus galloprovincialis TaxID=29158 RepID=UPI003F7B7871
MTVGVNTSFTQTLNDPNSQNYKSVTNDFCNEIDKVYKNNTDYKGCIVSSLKSGSILVNYIIYFIDTPTQSMETNTKLILTSHLNDTSSQLGAFTVISVVVHDVSVESLSSPPSVQIFKPPQSSSLISIVNSAETPNLFSTVQLSSTMMSPLEISSSLNIEISTTQMKTISTLGMSHSETRSIAKSMSESTFSETSVLMAFESTSLLESYAPTDMITSVISSFINDEERLATTSNSLISDSFSAMFSPTNSFHPVPSVTLIQNTADTLTTEISTNEMMSVSISPTVKMPMTTSYSTEQTVTKLSITITTDTNQNPNEDSTSDLMSVFISYIGQMSIESIHAIEYSMSNASSTRAIQTTHLPTLSMEVDTSPVITILKEETMPSVEYMSTEINSISTIFASKEGTTPSDKKTYFSILTIEGKTSYQPTTSITDSIILETTADKMTPVASTYQVTLASSTDRLTPVTILSTDGILASLTISSNDETESVSILVINETISPVTVLSTSELMTHEFTTSTNYTTTTLTTRLTEDTHTLINPSLTEETTMPQTILPADDTTNLETILHTMTSLPAEGTEASVFFPMSTVQTTLITTLETTLTPDETSSKYAV